MIQRLVTWWRGMRTDWRNVGDAFEQARPRPYEFQHEDDVATQEEWGPLGR
jgi:hypothetical protein